ncbi:hypothetical protein NQ317_000313 [Molorchus minor]|uniref:Uncharacterized protein n=1 Tax=Molorchus minor TaxID=1323400 RepID=A0ABQ9J0V2_9CUCU|nr:hypothetical protein NQ317_000313 [Molorchus minor]
MEVTKKCYIRNNKLIVDQNSYTADELEQLNQFTNNIESISSSALLRQLKTQPKALIIKKNNSTKTTVETPKKSTKQETTAQPSKSRNLRSITNKH